MPCHDSACQILAQHLVRGVSGCTDSDIGELARAIQDAVEKWWEARVQPVTEWLDPTLPAPANPLKFARKAEAQRSLDEIQRAHDLVGQFCVDTHDPVTFEHVSALCWVLRHDHNTAFAQILEEVEARLDRLGIAVVRLPELRHGPGCCCTGCVQDRSTAAASEES